MKSNISYSHIYILLFVMLSYFHSWIFYPLFLAIFFALVFSVAGKYMSKKTAIRNQKIRSILLVFLFFVLLIVAGAAVWDYIWDNFSLLVSELEAWYINIRDSLSWFTSPLLGWSTPSLDSLSEWSEIFSFETLSQVVWWTFTSMNFLLLTLLLTVVLLWYSDRLVYSVSRIYPSIHKHISIAEDVVSAYMKWILLMILIITGMYFVWLMIFWVEYAYIIALCAWLAALVPTVGTFLGWVMAVSATWILTNSVFSTAWILFRFIWVQLIEEYVILPKVVGNKVSLNAYASIVWVILFWYIWWIVWIFLSLPCLWVISQIWKKDKTRYYYLLSQHDVSSA